MTDKFMRHFIAFCFTLVVFFAYLAGYYSGQLGWWWSGFSLIIIYLAFYKFISVGNH